MDATSHTSHIKSNAVIQWLRVTATTNTGKVVLHATPLTSTCHTCTRISPMPPGLIIIPLYNVYLQMAWLSILYFSHHANMGIGVVGGGGPGSRIIQPLCHAGPPGSTPPPSNKSSSLISLLIVPSGM